MSGKNEPRFSERALFLLNPEKGAEKYRDRLFREKLSGMIGKGSGKKVMTSTGYGNHGASQTLNSMIGWLAGGGSAEDDIDLNGGILRKRARDLYAGGGLARSGPATLTTSVVGWGIMPQPTIDGTLLNMGDEEADEWERNTLREFRLWAESHFCDAEQSKDFFTLQELAFRNQLMSGDVFVLFGMTPNPRTPYQLTLRLIEADRISTPESSDGESEVRQQDGGGRIVDGVEIDKEGRVIRYHIASRHPLMEESDEEVTWTTIDAFGSGTGDPNILHVMTYERPEQRRGVPFVASQIEQIKQLDRYINSELAANVVAAMLTAFLESESNDGKAGMEDAIDADEKVTDDELHLELAPGAIYDLPPGKHVNTVNPIRNNSAFEQFVQTMITVIGASMEIPKEVLIKKYDSNYTAARSALLDFWRTVRVYRTRFNRQFCQPIYEMWLAEAVANGRVEAPGFFDDPAIRAAWCGCNWTGSSMGHVDPMKEINAAEKRIQLNISTEEQEAREYNGNDWSENIRQRKKEIAEYQQMYGEMNTDNKNNDAEPEGEGDDNGQ